MVEIDRKDVNESILKITILSLCIGNLFNSPNPNMDDIISWIDTTFVPMSHELLQNGTTRDIETVSFFSKLMWQKGIGPENIDDYILILKKFIDIGLDPHKKEGKYQETALQSYNAAKSKCFSCITEEHHREITNLLNTTFKPKDLKNMLTRILSRVTPTTVSKFANQFKIIWYYNADMVIANILRTITIVTEQPKKGYFANTSNLISTLLLLIGHPVVDDEYKNLHEVKNSPNSSILKRIILNKLQNTIQTYEVKTSILVSKDPTKLGASMGTVFAKQDECDVKIVNQYIKQLLNGSVINIPTDCQDKTLIQFLSHYVNDIGVSQKQYIFDSLDNENKQLFVNKKFSNKERFLLMDIFDSVYGKNKKPVFMH